MDNIFLEDEREIEKLKDRLEKLKYIQLCFIEQIDNGAVFSKDKTGASIEIKLPLETTDYKLLSEHYSKVSNIYSAITESIDKVKINFEPTVNVVTTGNNIKVTVGIYKPVVVSSVVDTSERDRQRERERDRQREMDWAIREIGLMGNTRGYKDYSESNRYYDNNGWKINKY